MVGSLNVALILMCHFFNVPGRGSTFEILIQMYENRINFFKNLGLATAVLVAVSAVFFFWFSDQSHESFEKSEFRKAYIDGDEILVEIVEENKDLRIGLSGRDGIGYADGLLFVFPEEDIHGIWMKDMRFSIDIIWIDRSGRVIFIKEDVSPETFPEVFRPYDPALFVLEVESGMVAEMEWGVGSLFTIH